MQRSLKGKLVIGLAAVAVVACAGGAYAATQSSGPSTRQAFLNDVAKRLHVTPQQLSAALNGAEQDQLQAQVKAGRLSQSQANQLQQRLKQKGNAGGAPFGFFGPVGPPGQLRPAVPYGAPGAPGAPKGPGTPGGAFPRFKAFPAPFLLGGLASAAGYLGLTDAQLFQQLSSGKSLAQIATAKGKSVGGLEQSLLAAQKARLDKLVKAKMITSAQEQKALSNFKARASRQINQKGLNLPRFRAPALRFGGGAPGPGGGAPAPKAPKSAPASPLGPAAQLFAQPAPPTA